MLSIPKPPKNVEVFDPKPPKNVEVFDPCQNPYKR